MIDLALDFGHATSVLAQNITFSWPRSSFNLIFAAPSCRTLVLFTSTPPMAPLTRSAGAALQVCARQRLPAVCSAPTISLQRRQKADAKATFESPYSNGEHDPNKIPDFSKYMSRKGEPSNKLFSYFMAGTMGALAAAGAKATVNGT